MTRLQPAGRQRLALPLTFAAIYATHLDAEMTHVRYHRTDTVRTQHGRGPADEAHGQDRRHPAGAGEGQQAHPDSDHRDAVKGFNVQVTAGGMRSFVLRYRAAGRERQLTIGQFSPSAWSTSAARKQAGKLRQQVDQGGDPLSEREAEQQEQDTTGLFEGRAKQFLAHGRRKRGLPLRPATKREYQRALLTYAKPLHGELLAEIRRGQIAELIRDVATVRGEVTAMRTRAALSRLWTWAIANGHAEANPVTGTEGYATPKRSRVLNDSELRAIWAATVEPSDFNLIVRLCLWTGCRRSEAGGMAWSELDGATWAIPGERTKNGRVLVLPLPRQAVEALAAWPRNSPGAICCSAAAMAASTAGATPRNVWTQRSISAVVRCMICDDQPKLEWPGSVSPKRLSTRS